MSRPGKYRGERLHQTIRIPVKYVDVEVNASREELAELMQRLILDDEYRIRFNKEPEAILRKVGIDIDRQKLEEIGMSPITSMVKDLGPAPQAISVAIVVVGVIIGVIAPPKPAE